MSHGAAKQTRSSAGCEDRPDNTAGGGEEPSTNSPASGAGRFGRRTKSSPPNKKGRRLHSLALSRHHEARTYAVGGCLGRIAQGLGRRVAPGRTSASVLDRVPQSKAATPQFVPEPYSRQINWSRKEGQPQHIPAARQREVAKRRWTHLGLWGG